MTDTKSKYSASTAYKTNVKHDKYNNKCVCDICSCGLHKCPPGQRRKFEGHTTNQDFYTPHEIPKQAPNLQPYKIQQRKYDPEALQTNYQAQYTPKRVDSALIFRDRSVEYIPKKTPFYSETEYKTQYLKNPVPTEPAQPKFQYRPNKAKFQGTTSYNVEFQPKKLTIEPSSPTKYQRKVLPFTGESSYKEQFQRYNVHIDKPQEFKYRPNTAKFEGQSNYKIDYQQYNPNTYSGNTGRCAINELPAYPRECSPGKRHLHYSAQKNYWD